MVGVGGAFTAGATGGSADATLPTHTHAFTGSATNTVDLSHTHGITDPGHYHAVATGGYSGGQPGYVGGSNVQYLAAQNTDTKTTGITGTNAMSANSTHSHTVSGTNASQGSSATDANLQPYIVVYVWNRTV
jgi:hypothetical protein